MQEGKKRDKEKKRGPCDGEHSDGEMKKRNTGSSTEVRETERRVHELHGAVEAPRVILRLIITSLSAKYRCVCVSGAGSGEDSDVLSINADIDDSDIEGHKAVEAEEAALGDEALPPSAEPKVELQHDIDRSVSEILAPTSGSEPEDLREASPEKAAAEERAPAKQPSTQQLELLELEMRARAIKALMKASQIQKHTHC
ncbi:caspase activity and apoptosis inhibitor 1-like [Sinocyclocheilus rhinocerous]|uniref:caspase activity and apoptosis inhibitor 1-like n=1 Tax=Sinocyclocheilus rhinocerous TaxID=307959 RepID=UPI0007B7BE69|nr:PREDICTED: caspase activity and apoptosis inhibitor 1-like [Sinocyclocheilus rhinocerous]